MEVLSYTLHEIEKHDVSPDLIVCLEETYPIRPTDLLEVMIQRLIDEGLDTVVAGKIENCGIWIESDGDLKLLGDGFMPRKLKKNKTLVGLLGLGFVTYVSSLRKGDIFRGRVGIYEVDDPLFTIEFHDRVSSDFARILNDRVF